MDKKDLKNFADVIENNIEKDLKVITSIVYKYDVEKITEGINTLSIEDQDKVLEVCINKYLTEIQKYSLSTEQYERLKHDSNEILEFYEDRELAEIAEEATCVAYDLILKITGHNNRKLDLPINIDYIKSFCINNEIKEKDIQLTVLFIVLNLSSACYCLKHKDYSK